MTRSLLAPLLALALLASSGCGVVEESARQLVARALGDGAAAVFGDAKQDAPSDVPGKGGGQGLSIAADEDAAGAVADPEEDEGGATGFYKIVEPNGTIRFTSNLASVPAEQRSKAERLKMAPSKPRAARSAPAPRNDVKQLAVADATAQPPAARARARSGGDHEVVVYTTSWCGWCKKTRSWLDGKGVEYVNKDIESDDGAAAEMRDLVGGDSGVPVVVIDGEVIQGFNQQRMAELLEI